MAFASTFIGNLKEVSGLVIQKYTWSGAGVTTGTITLQTSTEPQIVEVIAASPSSDGDTSVQWAADAGSNKVKLTFTSADTGTVIVTGIAR